MSIDYPAGLWRIYVVDDASADHTPDVMRREDGAVSGLGVPSASREGRPGKAHTLNHGIRTILARTGPRRVHDHGRRRPLRAGLAPHGAPSRRRRGRWRHGLREGRQPAAATSSRASSASSTSPRRRRADAPRTCMGGLACMAGGAHCTARQPDGVGGAIDTSTLAEDTYTTFKTQVAGRRVSVRCQCRRLGRGARQRRRRSGSSASAGGAATCRSPWAFCRICGSGPTGTRCSATSAFGVLWFAIALMPVFMIVSSAGPDRPLAYLRPPWAPIAFAVLWSATSSATSSRRCIRLPSILQTARRSWFEGMAFPGLLALGVMMLAVLGLKPFAEAASWPRSGNWSWHDIAVQVVLGWSALSTFLAWVVYRLDKAGAPGATAASSPPCRASA